MVAETIVFVKGKNKEGFVLLGRIPDCFIDFFNEIFIKNDWGGKIERLVIIVFKIDMNKLK
jgi:hypothetical protein